MMFSFSCQIDAEPRRSAQRDGDDPALLSYDLVVVSAAKNWKYAPATLNGIPVKFKKTINISLKPPA
jgi:hypothetical protein